MILIDASQLMISSILADTGSEKLDIDLIRHVTLNSLRSYRKKFHKQYGEVVLAIDSRNSWRKECFPHYKSNRKKNRKDSGIDWNSLFELMNVMKQELREFFPYKVIEVDFCEGDDIIAVLSRYTTENMIDGSSFLEEPEKTMIISSDEDFLQLHNRYVKQTSIKTKKELKLEKTIKEVLHDHICRGDSSDGVPNVLSDDLVFVEERRQKSIYTVKVDEWFKNLPTDEQFVKNYNRNKMLIDLNMIPMDYQVNIINTYLNYKTNGREKLMKYFMSRRLTNLMDDIQDF